MPYSEPPARSRSACGHLLEVRAGALAVVVCLLIAAPNAVAAQDSVASRQLFRGNVDLETPWLALLREANAGASEEQLHSIVFELLSDLSRTPGLRDALESQNEPVPCCDRTTNVYQVAFRAGEAADAPLVRIFVYRRGLSRGALPGIAGPGRPLFELFIAEDLNVTLQSTYSSVPQADPLEAQSTEFVKAVLAGVGLPVSIDRIRTSARDALRAMPPRESAALARHAPLAVTLSRVELPDERARITIAHSISITDPALHMRAQAAWLADAVRRGEIVRRALDAADSGPALSHQAPPEGGTACSAIAAADAKAVAQAVASGECSPLRPDPTKCFTAVRNAVSAAHVGAAEVNAECLDAYPLGRRFLSIAPEKLPGAKGSVVVRNAPKAHWSFGVGSAFIGGISTDADKPRTEVSGGRIVVDPFTRLLASGTVNWIPAGYDPEAVRMRTPERFRVFGGVAFAPYFGGTAGAGWALNRYLAANVGYARLGYDTPKPGEQIDSSPSDANRAAPFDLAWTNAWFVGVTFTVK